MAVRQRELEEAGAELKSIEADDLVEVKQLAAVASDSSSNRRRRARRQSSRAPSSLVSAAWAGRYGGGEPDKGAAQIAVWLTNLRAI